MAHSLFIGGIALHGTLQAYIVRSMHEPHSIHIGTHACLKEYSALHGYYHPVRLPCPPLEVGAYHRMNNAIDHFHPLRIAKHIRREGSPIEPAFRIVDIVSHSTNKSCTDSRVLIHQALSLTVAIINRHAHQAQQTRHDRLSTANAPRDTYYIWSPFHFYKGRSAIETGAFTSIR